MNLLLSPELISLYFSNFNKFVKTEEELILSSIFSNSNNKFILNKKLLEKYESEFLPDSNELDAFQNELVILLNNRSLNILATKDEVIDILQETNDNYLLYKSDKETYLNLSLTSLTSINNNFSAFLDNFNNSKSKDYLYFYLAAYNPIGLTKRYYEFESNSEIKEFLENIYSLRTHNEINIFDRYINLSHPYYNVLKNKGLQIKYHTITKRDIVEKRDDYTKLNAFFSRCSMLVYRGQKNSLHERRIMFNNIIIEFDNDIANILVTEPTWKINVYVCNTILSQIETKKRRHFSRDLTT